MFKLHHSNAYYNHAISNSAIYSHEKSQDKLPEASYRQSIIVTKVHDKLHEKLFISLCSFLWINESGCEFVLKKLMVKNSLIEKTYVVGTNWICLIGAISICTYNICYYK